MRHSPAAALALGFLLGLAPPSPAAGTSTEGTAAQIDETPLYFGVVGFYYPRLMFVRYGPLVDYLSEHTGRRWELRLRATYDETVQELCSGRLTAAYLGPLTYVRAHAACGAEPVARLNTGGRESYRSYILVRADSPIRELVDLRGKRFAFGSAISTSSHLVPRAILAGAGLEPGRDFSCAYLEHHELAARAVELGEADACGVRDIVGDRFLERGLRLLVTSDPIPNFPIVVSPGLPDDLRSALTRALVDLPREDTAAARRMSAWDPELAGGFARATDTDYDTIRKLAAKVLGAGALTLPEEDLGCAGVRP